MVKANGIPGTTWGSSKRKKMLKHEKKKKKKKKKNKYAEVPQTVVGKKGSKKEKFKLSKTQLEFNGLEDVNKFLEEKEEKELLKAEMPSKIERKREKQTKKAGYDTT